MAAPPPHGLSARERRWLWVTELPFVPCAIAVFLWVPPVRSLDVAACVLLVAGFAVACRVRIELPAPLGDAPSLQLVFVPMLFFAPLNVVPLLVLAGFLLDDLTRRARDRRSLTRSVLSLGDSWFAFGPVLVLAAAGHDAFAWQHAPLYALALAVQLFVEVAVTAARASLLAGASPPLFGVVATSAVDLVLSIPALAVVAIAVEQPWAAVLVEAALLIMAGGFVAERSGRVLERERAVERARRAVTDERLRIARELHDVVAHHVSVMGIQAGGASAVLRRDPDQAEAALRSIAGSGREAVRELQRMLGFLRSTSDAGDDAPQPGLEQLPALASSVSEARLAVEVNVEGEQRPLPAAVDASAYRIAQEAVTNTLKHAAASRVTITLRYGRDELDVRIVDDGRGNGGAPPATGGGHGLTGMRERAALHGGSLEAGPTAGGGFEVHATLPLGEP